MKICMLTYRGNPFCGGQGVYVSSLARELAQQGHEVHCISGPPYPLEIEGVTVHRVGGLLLHNSNGQYPDLKNPLEAFSPLNFYEAAAFRSGIFPEMTSFSIRAWLLLKRLVRHHRFDVIHDNQTLGWGLLPIKNLGIPLLSTIHHPLTIDRLRAFEPPTSFMRQFWQMMFYPMIMQGMVARRMRSVVTVSHAAANDIVSDFRVAEERISVVYNGVDTEQFRPIPEIERVPGRVLFVGNIQDPNKGGKYLLRAMSLIKSKAELVVVTGGIADQKKFDSDLEELGIRDRVRVHLQLSGNDLVRMFASAQVAVSPSVYEGFGFPAAEAMACGLPLVAARGGALPEVVGDAGLLVPIRDPGALAEAIDTLLRDETLRKRLGKAARNRMLEKFQWPQAASRMVDIYQSCIDAHG